MVRSVAAVGVLLLASPALVQVKQGQSQVRCCMVSTFALGLEGRGDAA